MASTTSLAPLRYNRADKYGSDFRMNVDGVLDPALSCTSGLEVLATDLINRLRGHVPWDATYGYPILTNVNSSMDATAGEISREVQRELLKDERVADVTCDAQINNATERMTLNISVRTSSDDSFGLVASIDPFTNRIVING